MTNQILKELDRREEDIDIERESHIEDEEAENE